MSLDYMPHSLSVRRGPNHYRPLKVLAREPATVIQFRSLEMERPPITKSQRVKPRINTKPRIDTQPATEITRIPAHPIQRFRHSATDFSARNTANSTPSVVVAFSAPGPRTEAKLLETTREAAHRSTTRNIPRSASPRSPDYSVNQVTHSLPQGFTEAKKLTIITMSSPKQALTVVASYEAAERSIAALHRRSPEFQPTPR